MDSGHSNEARWPNNTLLTYTLPRTVKVRESVGVERNRFAEKEISREAVFALMND